MSERMLKIPQVAELCALSQWTVWRMVLDGRLPSYKIGRSRRVGESDLRHFLDQVREEGGRRVPRRDRTI